MYSEIFNMDYEIRIGANQAENDALVKKAPQHAMWFHLKDFPSAHAVVINTAKTYDADVIRRAATLVKERAAPGTLGSLLILYSLYANKYEEYAYIATIGLAAFTAMTILIFHFPTDPSEMISFTKNLSIFGGLMLLSQRFIR